MSDTFCEFQNFNSTKLNDIQYSHRVLFQNPLGGILQFSVQNVDKKIETGIGFVYIIIEMEPDILCLDYSS